MITVYQNVQDKVARLLWDKFHNDAPVKVRSPWRTAEWLTITDRVMETVLADAVAIESERGTVMKTCPKCGHAADKHVLFNAGTRNARHECQQCDCTYDARLPITPPPIEAVVRGEAYDFLSSLDGLSGSHGKLLNTLGQEWIDFVVSFIMKRTDAEVVHWAQAMLTALNVGDVKHDSPLHLKLREVMLAYCAGKQE